MSTSTNRFPTRCTGCRNMIDAGKGTLTGKVAGRWTAVHTGTCDGSLDIDTSEAECIAAECADLDWTERNMARLLDATTDERHLETGEAWALWCEGMEHFDGEVEIERAHRRTFDRVVAMGPAVWASTRERAA